MRALLAFLALPGVVAFAVPAAIAWPITVYRPTGVAVIAIGTVLLIWCVRTFYTAGKGTLAPWDPPRHLVTSGPYRVTRNPMYIAVSLILAGWAWATASAVLWLYAGFMMMVFHVRVAIVEERWQQDTFRGEWDRYRAAVPRWIFPTRRALLVTAAAIFVALPLAGLIFEAYMDARTRREFSPPGTFVEVSGRQLHLLCLGEGSPIVMFEASGFGQPALSSQTVRERVATRTRVCSYDRIGMGWSDPAPPVLTFDALATDLAVLQDRASLPAPFVIVASSTGGWVAEMFARRYPERTAGLILLDAGTSGVIPDFYERIPYAAAGARITATLANLGVVRLLNPFNLQGDSDEMRRSRGFTYGGRAIGTLMAIIRGGRASMREFEQAPPLRSDLPLTVLSASDPRTLDIPGLEDAGIILKARRIQIHQDFAKQSSRGTWKMVPDSRHLIASDKPDAVIDEIFAMLDAIR